MKTPLSEIDSTVPDGEYYGMWCGNRVQFSTHPGEGHASTGDLYVKGNVPCVVTVANGAATVRETCK